MGAAYFIVLERGIDGVDIAMNGKSLSRQMESLDDAARQLGVRPLSEFFSVAPTQLNDFLKSEAVDAGDIAPVPLQQFTAQDGLVTVQALASHAAGQVDGVAEDLRECERILNAAREHGVDWHFEVDF